MKQLRQRKVRVSVEQRADEGDANGIRCCLIVTQVVVEELDITLPRPVNACRRYNAVIKAELRGVSLARLIVPSLSGDLPTLTARSKIKWTGREKLCQCCITWNLP